MFVRKNRSQCGYDADGGQKYGGSFLMIEHGTDVWLAVKERP